MQRLIDEAEDDLMFRRFEECLQKCLDCVQQAKTDVSLQENQEYISQSCSLAIQAYAELDRWQEVLPYITNVYDGIEDCPGNIVKLCLLLYSHVNDYNTCTAVGHIWLRKASNFKDEEYANIVNIYVREVLIPQDQWDNIPVFLSSCPGVEADMRQAMLDEIRVLKERIAAEKLQKLEQQRLLQQREEENQNKGAEDPVGKMLGQLIRLMKQHHTLTGLVIAGQVSVFLLVIYILYLRSQTKGSVFTGLDLKSRLKKYWMLAVMMWKSMFAPYYQSR